MSESKHSSLFSAIQKAEWDHYQKCQGEGPINIGRYSHCHDDLKDHPDAHQPIWIHNDNLTLTIGCPGGFHERFRQALNVLFFSSLSDRVNEVLGEYVLKHGGSTTVPGLRNELGCMIDIIKQPDSSLYLAGEEVRGNLFPCVVAEVGGKHDPLHLLFCQPAAWLNVQTKTNYALVVKYEEQTPFIDLWLLGRNEQASGNIHDSNRRLIIPPSESRESTRRIETFRKKAVAANKNCLPLNEDVPSNPGEIEDTYGFRILHHFTIDLNADLPLEMNFEFDMKELLRYSAYQWPENENNSIIVSLIPTLRRIQDYFRTTMYA